MLTALLIVHGLGFHVFMEEISDLSNVVTFPCNRTPAHVVPLYYREEVILLTESLHTMLGL